MTDIHTIYKLLRRSELATLITTDRFGGSSDDVRDGFIHLSTAEQVPGTLAKHFSSDSNIFALDCRRLLQDSELRWEQSRGGALFPHLYRPLTIGDVTGIFPLHENKWPVE